MHGFFLHIDNRKCKHPSSYLFRLVSIFNLGELKTPGQNFNYVNLNSLFLGLFFLSLDYRFSVIR